MRHSHTDKHGGSRPVAIDVAGEPLGIVVPEAEGYRFLAVRFNAFAIDGRRFATVEAAREAARGALEAGSPG